MFREMRRQDRKLKDGAAVELLRNGSYGIISTIGKNGYPYGVPLSYVYMNHAIYFHCAPEGAKIENMRNDNRASFCVVGEAEPLPRKFSMRYRSVIVFGRTAEVEGKEKQEALSALLEKYVEDLEDLGDPAAGGAAEGRAAKGGAATGGAERYLLEGREYMKKAEHRTKVLKMTIEHLSGKARK